MRLANVYQMHAKMSTPNFCAVLWTSALDTATLDRVSHQHSLCHVLGQPVPGGVIALNGPHMKLQRQRLGLSQEDVAQEMGVDRSTVAGWETGRAYPDPRRLPLLAALLQTTTDKLLKANGEEVAQSVS